VDTARRSKPEVHRGTNQLFLRRGKPRKADFTGCIGATPNAAAKATFPTAIRFFLGIFMAAS
jgi:hypothetical protein